MKRKYLFVLLAVVIVSFVFTAELAAKVVKVEAFVKPVHFAGKCPKRFDFVGKITVNRPGVVKYRWIRSDGAIAPVKTIRFLRRGTRTVTSYWQLSTQGKHWQAIRVLAPNKLQSNRAVFTLKCRRELARPMVVKPPQVVAADRVRPPTQSCPDPAAESILFTIVRRDSQFRGRIRITGVVKNIGGASFISDPRQAEAQLLELPAGVPPASATTGRIVARRAISNLAAGAVLNLSYERDWNSSSPSEGEFPNSYRVLITYDPDIYMDENKQNDDCNQSNNKKDRSGTEINDMLK